MGVGIDNPLIRAQGRFLLVIAAAVVLLFLVVAWSTYRSSQTTDQICRSNDNTIAAVTAILQYAQTTKPAAHQTAAQIIAGERFYAFAYGKLASSRC